MISDLLRTSSSVPRLIFDQPGNKKLGCNSGLGYADWLRLTHSPWADCESDRVEAVSSFLPFESFLHRFALIHPRRTTPQPGIPRIVLELQLPIHQRVSAPAPSVLETMFLPHFVFTSKVLH